MVRGRTAAVQFVLRLCLSDPSHALESILYTIIVRLFVEGTARQTETCQNQPPECVLSAILEADSPGRCNAPVHSPSRTTGVAGVSAIHTDAEDVGFGATLDLRDMRPGLS